MALTKSKWKWESDRLVAKCASKYDLFSLQACGFLGENPSRLAITNEMPATKNKTQLQSFLGLVNY